MHAPIAVLANTVGIQDGITAECPADRRPLQGRARRPQGRGGLFQARTVKAAQQRYLLQRGAASVAAPAPGASDVVSKAAEIALPASWRTRSPASRPPGTARRHGSGTQVAGALAGYPHAGARSI
ncbi:hypothetical protein ACU686_30090 [Yinghuangia aomiensis]